MTSRILIAAFLILGLTPPALAHAFLQHANPGAGDALASPPKEILLDFTKPLDPAGSSVAVTDASGNDMEAAHAIVDGPDIRVELKPLAAGSYHVVWRALSTDTHETQGGYSFTVNP
jgi:methionine-rich copper-binding protein CopC